MMPHPEFGEPGTRRKSVSLAAVEFIPEGAGTFLIYTEEGAFLDGYDNPKDRERGTADVLDALGKELRRQSTNTGRAKAESVASKKKPEADPGSKS